MATYAIGDVQGCMTTLERLLRQLRFSHGDRLWLVGDLVNRGPHNREVLRFVRKLGARADVVLGNHDLHLIARHYGLSEPKKRDTLDDVLDARDADELVVWLKSRPLVYHEGNHLLVHAGLLPRWTVHEAQKRAGAVARALANGKLKAVLRGEGNLAEAARALTRLRMLARDDSLADWDGAPAKAPAGTVPWYAHPERR